MLLDLGVVAALVGLPPEASPDGLFTRVRSDLVGVGWYVLAVVAVVAVLVAVGIGVYGSFDQALARVKGETLSVFPRVIRLGTLQPGSQARGSITIVNRGTAVFRVIGGTSDCSCVTTEDLPVSVEPGSSVIVQVTVTLAGGHGEFRRQVWLIVEQDGALRKVALEVTATVVAES